MQPRYEIGQKVWAADIYRSEVSFECPDCKGSKKWKAITPAGAEFEINCQRCGYRHSYDKRYLELKAIEWKTSVRELTIGSVRTDSGEDPESRVQYMCEETGIGSGTLWRQTTLFPSKEEAELYAKARAVKQNSEEVQVSTDRSEKQIYSNHEIVSAIKLHDAVSIITVRDKLRNAHYPFEYFMRLIDETPKDKISDWEKEDFISKCKDIIKNIEEALEEVCK